MRLYPEHIAAYTSCPLMYFKGRSDIIYPTMNDFEYSLRRAFIEGEREALLKDTIVDVNKLVRGWDNAWWPIVAKKKIPMKDAERQTLKATQIFMDYCSYEMTDYLCPTVGVDVESQKDIERSILISKADIIKVDLEKKHRNTVLVNFTKRKLSINQAAYDNAIKAIAYGFYTRKNESLTHLNIYLDENINKIKVNISVFQDEDFREIEKMIYHVHRGIKNDVRYMNTNACKECKLCPELKL